MYNKELYLDKRIIRTQDSFTQSLIALLKEKTFRDVSITDITNHAKISRATFYNHFKNIDDLLKYVIEDIVVDLLNAYRAPYKNFKQFRIEQVKPATVKLFDHVYRHSDFYATIINSDINPAFHNKLIEELSLILIKDINLRNPNINIEFYANYQANAIAGLIIKWVTDGFIYSPNYMAEQLMLIINISSEHSLEHLN